MEKLEKEAIEFIIIHHSRRVFDCPLFIKLRHKFIRGWSDIGYHFIIGNGVLSTDGQVYQARSLEYVGAHAYGYNQKSIGICLIGNLDEKVATFKQYRALISLLNELRAAYSLSSDNILGHRETENCPKTCPGLLFPTTRFRQLLRAST